MQIFLTFVCACFWLPSKFRQHLDMPICRFRWLTQPTHSSKQAKEKSFKVTAFTWYLTNMKYSEKHSFLTNIFLLWYSSFVLSFLCFRSGAFFIFKIIQRSVFCGLAKKTHSTEDSEAQRLYLKWVNQPSLQRKPLRASRKSWELCVGLLWTNPTVWLFASKI